MADGISPDTGAPISGETAKQWIENYRKKFPGPDEVIAHFYGCDIINKILAQPDCIGIRFYYAIDDKGSKQLILVGVSSDGDNMWDLNSTQPMEGGMIADKGGPCPPYCPLK